MILIMMILWQLKQRYKNKKIDDKDYSYTIPPSLLLQKLQIPRHTHILGLIQLLCLNRIYSYVSYYSPIQQIEQFDHFLVINIEKDKKLI